MSISEAVSGGALLISLVALGITWRQWSDSHNQLLLSMKPSINLDTASDSDDPPVGISIDNAGPGPAIIKSITYYVDKKMVGNVDKLVDFEHLDYISTYDFDAGDTLGVGQYHFLLSYGHKPHGKDEEKELDEFMDVLEHHLAAEVEFCPALPGECSVKCSTRGWCK